MNLKGGNKVDLMEEQSEEKEGIGKGDNRRQKFKNYSFYRRT